MTSTKRPPEPNENNVRTFYRSPMIDRITGRYTVAWMNEDRLAQIRVHNRLTDLEGNRPSLGALMRVPRTVQTYFEAKRKAILDRPLPFLVYEAIDHLEGLVFGGTRVIELGGGNSTLWFLERGAHVVTIEHSPEWVESIRTAALERLGKAANDRLEIIVARGDDAIAAATAREDREFDLALVDCMNAFTWRRAGVESLVPKIRTGGTMCLDNSDHPNNWSAVTLLGRERRKRFTGLAPMCPVISQTSFWTM